MKRTLASIFRAMLFAVCLLLLARFGGLEIKTGQGVAVFLVAIAIGWIVFERVLTIYHQRKKPKAKPY